MSYLTDFFRTGINPSQEAGTTIPEYADDLRAKEIAQKELEETLSVDQQLQLTEFLRKKNAVCLHERSAVFEYGFSLGMQLIYEALCETEL